MYPSNCAILLVHEQLQISSHRTTAHAEITVCTSVIGIVAIQARCDFPTSTLMLESLTQ